MLLTHQQIFFCANQTTRATLFGKHEVQRGVFFLFPCRENRITGAQRCAARPAVLRPCVADRSFFQSRRI